jgi:hypothetical protein
LGVVEGLVWFISPECAIKNILKIMYGMIYLPFQGILLKLRTYTVSGAVNQWVRPPLNPMITTLKIIIFEVEIDTLVVDTCPFPPPHTHTHSLKVKRPTG